MIRKVYDISDRFFLIGDSPSGGSKTVTGGRTSSAVLGALNAESVMPVPGAAVLWRANVH